MEGGAIFDSKILDDFLQLSSRVIEGGEPEDVVGEVMELAARVSGADACFFFRVAPDGFLNLEYSKISSLNIEVMGAANQQLFGSVFLPEAKAKKEKHPVEICAINGEIINSSNIYGEAGLDTSIIYKFDEENDYTTLSMLVFPIFDSKKNIVGVAMFVNAQNSSGKVVNFVSEQQSMMEKICRLMVIPIERKQTGEAYTRLLEWFIEVLAKAIDTKSPYTGMHCQRVPIIARMLASAVVAETEGPFKNFDMSEEDWYALHIASWLHDCGKIVTPDYLIDKAVKLETVYNRIHEVRTRFEVLRRDAHIEYLQKRLGNVAPKDKLQAEFVDKVKQLKEDFEFIGQCNIGDIRLSKDDVERIDKIATRSFVRYFDRTVGLSWMDKEKIADNEGALKQEVEYVLQDRKEDLESHYNQGEITNLKIRQGTINDEERAKINEHVVTTIQILKDMPFAKNMTNIVEYAGAHHERVDGKGYPNGLRGDELSVPAKIMAIADVFEALTAKERPYKRAKKLSEVLAIMRDMKNTGHLDPDLYDIFIKRGVYADYSKEYVSEELIDEVNPEEFL